MLQKYFRRNISRVCDEVQKAKMTFSISKFIWLQVILNILDICKNTLKIQSNSNKIDRINKDRRSALACQRASCLTKEVPKIQYSLVALNLSIDMFYGYFVNRPLEQIHDRWSSFKDIQMLVDQNNQQAVKTVTKYLLFICFQNTMSSQMSKNIELSHIKQRSVEGNRYFASNHLGQHAVLLYFHIQLKNQQQ
ncbi:Hypothetical_protein [Hexamita inflata]|uniref:Hypothetical_protein n=1 Tax=Hexamita inflata TaxID=28002 RepID=A0ABP1J591_9EUKA